MEMTRIPRLSRGISLIEVTFAVLILTGSFVVLLGLQSLAVDREVTDYNRQRAMLIARRIMTQIETRTEGLEPENRKGSALDVLEFISGLQPYTPEEEQRILQGFEANLNIEELALPGFEDKSLLQITLDITWSSSPLDRLNLVYFVPKPEIDE